MSPSVNGDMTKFHLTGKKQTTTTRFGGNTVCGYMDVASPVIRAADEPRSCSFRSLASPAKRSRNHIGFG